MFYRTSPQIHPDYAKRAPGTVSPVNDIAIITLDRDITR